MKTRFVLLALVCTTSLSAQSFTLSADAKGVTVDAGTSGRIVLAAPVIAGSDKKDRKPVFTPAEDGTSATAVYPDGFTLKIALSAPNGTITYSFDQVPADAASLKISAALPISYNNGGTYATNGGAAQPFPGEPGKQLFAQGPFSQLDLVTGVGEGLSFTTPPSYQQLQDNRIWGTQSFSWIYHYDFLRYPNETSFTISVAPAKTAVPAKK